MKKQSLCYACDSVATTREHVPARSLFPREKRTNLWTVPSCAKHNLDASLDVEYVRNVLSYQYGTNSVAEDVLETTKRSFDRSNKLFAATVTDFSMTVVDGIETGQHRLDLKRLHAVMAGTARALALRDFGRKYIGSWRVVCANLKSEKPQQKWEDLLAVLRNGTYIPVVTPHPDVFSYGVHISDMGLPIYRMAFYSGFEVYAWPAAGADAESEESADY